MQTQALRIKANAPGLKRKTVSSDLVYVLLIIFFSTLVRAAFGFGDALIGMPLLAMTIGLKQATPLMALTPLAIGLLILIRHWRHVQFGSTWRLIISTLAGVPLGIYFLKGVNEAVVKIVLALLLIIFSIFKLLEPKMKKLEGEAWSYPVGILAGMLGGAYNSNGPPIIFYASLKQWPPSSFRATLQGYFFATGIFVAVGHVMAGNCTPIVLHYFIFSMPVMLVAIYVGGKIHQKIPAEHFIKLIYWLLIGIGLLLIATSIKLF